MSLLPFCALEDCSNRHKIHLTHATTKPFQVNCLQLLSSKTMSQSLLFKILGLKYWLTMVWRLVVPYKRLDQERNNHNCTKCGSSVHFNTFSIYVEMKSWLYSSSRKSSTKNVIGPMLNWHSVCYKEHETENAKEEQLVNYFCLLEFCFHLAFYSSTQPSQVLLLTSANFTLLLTGYKVSITIKQLTWRHLTTITTA